MNGYLGMRRGATTAPLLGLCVGTTKSTRLCYMAVLSTAGFLKEAGVLSAQVRGHHDVRDRMAFSPCIPALAHPAALKAPSFVCSLITRTSRSLR